jgi:hypothetical protein
MKFFYLKNALFFHLKAVYFRKKNIFLEIRLIQAGSVSLAELDLSVPVVIYCLDNSSFKVTNAAGDLLSISRSKTDKKYHVIGDLAVTPFSLMANSIKEKSQRIFMLLMACCETATAPTMMKGLPTPRTMAGTTMTTGGRTAATARPSPASGTSIPATTVEGAAAITAAADIDASTEALPQSPS